MKKTTIKIPPGTDFNDFHDNQPQQIVYGGKPSGWLYVNLDLKGFICAAWIRKDDISMFHVNVDDESELTTVVILKSGQKVIADHPVNYFKDHLNE